MKQLTLLLLGGSLIFILPTAGYLGLWYTATPRDWAFKNRFDHLQIGMTKNDVERILRGPAQSSSVIIGSAGAGQATYTERLASWSGKFGETASVVFNEKGVACSMDFTTPEAAAAYFHPPEEPTFLTRVRRWLGLDI